MGYCTNVQSSAKAGFADKIHNPDFEKAQKSNRDGQKRPIYHFSLSCRKNEGTVAKPNSSRQIFCQTISIEETRAAPQSTMFVKYDGKQASICVIMTITVNQSTLLSIIS